LLVLQITSYYCWCYGSLNTIVGATDHLVQCLVLQIT